MLLSSEIPSSQGVFAFPKAGAMLLLHIRSGASSPAGVEDHVQTDHWGSPRTWEILSSPRPIPGGSYRVTNSRPRRWYSSAEERKERVPTEVPPSEGNEARWDGRQGVVTL